ncbi:hypothetical protein [Actinocrispum wychmicini]|uniref:Uncharacterized protein n=1 Tax=Actinocrispum wychmicini TaxID=1213861 RepID=A0A4R2JPS7_9PSEU|nr:hypothetical protein [Actinocrispum wychmicini]TCO62191.1 hypothetical protein EV192_102328 [Actinocrispum wychmicini]
MTMMTLSEEDALFELEVRVVPLDAKDDYGLEFQMDTGTVHTSYVSESCSSRCTADYACSYTCRGFAAQGSTITPNMCI